MVFARLPDWPVIPVRAFSVCLTVLPGGGSTQQGGGGGQPAKGGGVCLLGPGGGANDSGRGHRGGLSSFPPSVRGLIPAYQPHLVPPSSVDPHHTEFHEPYLPPSPPAYVPEFGPAPAPSHDLMTPPTARETRCSWVAATSRLSKTAKGEAPATPLV